MERKVLDINSYPDRHYDDSFQQDFFLLFKNEYKHNVNRDNLISCVIQTQSIYRKKTLPLQTQRMEWKTYSKISLYNVDPDYPFSFFLPLCEGISMTYVYFPCTKNEVMKQEIVYFSFWKASSPLLKDFKD